MNKVNDIIKHKSCNLIYRIIDIDNKYVTLKALHNFSFSPRGRIVKYELSILNQFKLYKGEI